MIPLPVFIGAIVVAFLVGFLLAAAFWQAIVKAIAPRGPGSHAVDLADEIRAKHPRQRVFPKDLTDG